MTKFNILVTGGAGFIGSHLVDAVTGHGHHVRVLDSLVSQVHLENAPYTSGAELIRTDICEPKVLASALEDIDIVYHEAAEVGVGQSMYEIRRYVRTNSLGTSALLEEIVKRRRQIRKLVVASSMSIYGEGAYDCSHCGMIYPQLRPLSQLESHQWEILCPNCGVNPAPIATGETKPLFPSSIYAITKQCQEQLCLITGRAYGIPAVALRYFNVYGPRQALSNPYTGVCAIFSSRLLNDQQPLVYEDGKQSRDFVHVSDVVQANVLALESDRADYNAVNIGTGVATSIHGVAELLARKLGKNIKPEIVGKYREGDIRHCVADISRARNMLGYEPKVSLEEGISGLADWVKYQSANDLTAQATKELEARQLVR